MPIYGSDILPDATGRVLGAQDARWDGKFRNIDVSGTIAGTFTGLAIFKLQPKVVPWSATPTFDGTDRSAGFKMLLTGNVTAPSFINFPAGQLVSITLIQDATGGRTWVWPAGFHGGMDIGTLPNEHSSQLFWFDGLEFNAMSAGVISQ